MYFKFDPLYQHSQQSYMRHSLRDKCSHIINEPQHRLSTAPMTFIASTTSCPRSFHCNHWEGDTEARTFTYRFKNSFFPETSSRINLHNINHKLTPSPKPAPDCPFVGYLHNYGPIYFEEFIVHFFLIEAAYSASVKMQQDIHCSCSYPVHMIF